MKAQNGTLSLPYNWIQKRGSTGPLVWSSGAINNYAWSAVPNYLYNTNYLNHLLVDNQYAGNVAGTYDNNARTP